MAQSFTITDRLEARQHAALEAFDREGAWLGTGATSLLAWLRDTAGRAPNDAARISRVVRRLRQLPEVAEAWRTSRLSSAKVHAVVGVLNGNLNAQTGHLLESALRLADSGDRNVPVPQRRAEALGHLQNFLHAEQHTADARRRSGRHRSHPELALTPCTQDATFHDGTPVPTTTSERLCCDAIVHDVVIDNGQVVLYGGARRTITTSHPTCTSRPPGNHQPLLHT